MLECDYCGCHSPNHEEGWVTYPWEKDAEPNALGVLLFCPPCATAVFGPQLDADVEHMCIWKPRSPASGGES